MLEIPGRIISLAEERLRAEAQRARTMTKAQAEKLSPGLSLLPDLLESTLENRADFFKVWPHSHLSLNAAKIPEKRSQKRVVMVGIPGVPNKMFGPDHPYYFDIRKIRKALEEILGEEIDVVICPWAFDYPLAMKDPDTEKLIYIPQESALSTLFYFVAIVETQSDYVQAVQSYMDNTYQQLDDYALRINMQHSGGWEIMKEYMRRHYDEMHQRGKDYGITLGPPNSLLFGLETPNNLINLGRDRKFDPPFAYSGAKGNKDFFTGPDSPFVTSSSDVGDQHCFRVFDTGVLGSNNPIIKRRFVGAAHANLMTDPMIIKFICDHLRAHVGWNYKEAA